jgi:hypothetical protein
MIGLQSKKIVIALAIFLSATMTAPVVTTAAAGPGESEGAANDSPAKAASTSNGGDSGKSESSTPAPNPDPFVELQELKANVEAEAQRVAEQTQELDNERAALRDELQGIAALEAKLGIVPNPSFTPDATASIANPASTPNAANQGSPTQTITPQDSSNRIANLESRLKNFGPFQFSGDIRLRGEPFLGGPADRSQDRDRARYRVRFNIVAKLNDDISGGITLASGDINDPTTTNQTITGFYSRKTIAIDKAYVNYNPHEFKNLTLIGGKFGYPWYNTELTWDKDLNPEGFAQTLVFNPDIPVLKRIAFVGFELPFAEVAGVSLNDKSIVQSVTYGGQIQTTWQLAHWLKFGAFTGFYNFHNADPIALALAKASAKNPQTPLTGSLPLGTGNTVQNSIVTSTSTNIVTIGGTAFPTGVTTITNAQFASKFGLFDSLARFDVTTSWEKWPIAFVGDYVQNTEACANVDNIAAKPANTAALTFTQTTNFACNSHQRRGYWAEAQVGRAQKRGDWQFDYTRIFIEREAVLSNFDYSDIRQGSNVTEHRAMVIYQAHRNVQLSFTDLIGRPINFGHTKLPEPWLQRLQFDVIYTF